MQHHSLMASIVEIRIPTYRRPVLLRRALASLVSQTYPLWRCIVIDDDPGGETRNVCAQFNDSRIIYQENERNLGVGANIDRAFSLDPLPGSTHACVLEDDNYYFPDCLRSNLELMAREGVDVVLRNQYLETPSSFGRSRVGPRTSYDGQYVEGVVSRDELWGAFFYSLGANNAGLFWRVGAGLNFSTLAMIDCPQFQERLRTLCIDRRAYIALKPQIVYRDNGTESYTRVFGLRWPLQYLRLTTRERNICLMLFAYLRQRNLEVHIWQSRFRKIDAGGERVFWRVGIPLGVPTNLTKKDRMTLVIKRTFAKLGSLLITEPINYTIGENRIEARLRNDDR
jgi:glycosyltransferase involved in cell wall biosynthesis